MQVCVNETDKNLGPISADESDVIKKCHRQLYDIITYNKISWEEAKNLIEKIKTDLRKIVKKHSEKGSCSNFEEKFLLSKIHSISIPNFKLFGKYLKVLPWEGQL